MSAPAAPRAGPAARAAYGVRGFWASTIGKKVVMAVTGIMLIGFLLGHVTGNLLVFRGAQALNDYAATLKSLGALLWALRLGLLAAAALHVTAGIQLWKRAQAARPVKYGGRDPQVSTWASRTIRAGGVLLLVFIVFHVLHFTTGTIRPAGTFSHTDVYGNVIAGFRVWWVSLFYVVAMVALFYHLYHGAWSSMRTLGFTRPSANPLHRRVAIVLAVLLFIGFAVIPVAVIGGWLR